MGLKDTDLVNVRIETAGDALDFVIGDARKQIASLEWERFDIDPKRAGEIFDISYGVILNGANETNLNLPVKVVNSERIEEAAFLDTLAPHQKRQFFADSKYWLVLTHTLGPDEATRVRDYLWAKGIDVVAGCFEKDIRDVALSFSIGHSDKMLPLFGRLSTWLSV